MKKILSLVAVFILATSVMAQDDNMRPQRDRQRMNPTEMMNRRMEQMIKTYNLTEEQAAAVKALNEKFFAAPAQRPERNENADNGNRQQRRERMQGEQRGNRGGWGRNMEEYNAELKKILTEEQYKAYEEDQQKMRQRMGNGMRRGGMNGNRQRGQRDQQD